MTAPDPSLPPSWEPLVRRIAWEVAVEVVESAEVHTSVERGQVLHVPRGEETSGAAETLGSATTEQPDCACTPAAGPEEAGPPSGEDEAMRVARAYLRSLSEFYRFDMDGHDAVVLAEQFRAYGDARVNRLLDVAEHVYEGWSGPAKEVFEYMRTLEANRK